MTARKPCFECNDYEQDNMDIGECLESPLCTSVDGPCCFMIRGGHWETCTLGARSEEYPAFLAKQNQAQCPCCKGSGFISEAQMIDIEDLERRMTRRDDEPLLPPSPEEVLALIAEIRRLRGMMGHRKCTCDRGVRADSVGDSRHWIYCSRCMSTTNEFETEEEAWAAWDGIA